MDRSALCDECKMFHVEHFDEGCFDIGNICKVYGAFDYADGPRNVVFRFKYEGKRMLARQMAELIFQRVGEIGSCGDFLVPVPLHKGRERERGFNQAGLLATGLSILTGLPAYDGLMRRRETMRQFELSADERKANVSGAFELKEGFDVSGADVLLVDDILTTGATARECASVLKHAGARSVKLIVFAIAVMEI